MSDAVLRFVFSGAVGTIFLLHRIVCLQLWLPTLPAAALPTVKLLCSLLPEHQAQLQRGRGLLRQVGGGRLLVVPKRSRGCFLAKVDNLHGNLTTIFPAPCPWRCQIWNLVSRAVVVKVQRSVAGRCIRSHLMVTACQPADLQADGFACPATVWPRRLA